MTLRTLTATVIVAMLAGCTADGGGSSYPGSGSGYGAAEQACLRDVRRMTNNAELVVIGSNPYQGGGKYVTVGVGPGRAPWQCIGYNNGSTAEIMSLVNEGSL
jgi:hypothetical protein